MATTQHSNPNPESLTKTDVNLKPSGVQKTVVPEPSAGADAGVKGLAMPSAAVKAWQAGRAAESLQKAAMDAKADISDKETSLRDGMRQDMSARDLMGSREGGEGS